jgi:hypothetical protein
METRPGEGRAIWYLEEWVVGVGVVAFSMVSGGDGWFCHTLLWLYVLAVLYVWVDVLYGSGHDGYGA